MQFSWLYIYKPNSFSIVESLHGGELTTLVNYTSRHFCFVKIFVALAIPVDVPGHDGLFFAYHIEAVYLLPRDNDTVLTYPPIINKRSLSRAQLYENVERHLKRYQNTINISTFLNKISDYRQGYDGKNCLIRSICEAAEYSAKETGVLGDILHIILS